MWRACRDADAPHPVLASACVSGRGRSTLRCMRGVLEAPLWLWLLAGAVLVWASLKDAYDSWQRERPRRAFERTPEGQADLARRQAEHAERRRQDAEDRQPWPTYWGSLTPEERQSNLAKRLRSRPHDAALDDAEDGR